MPGHAAIEHFRIHPPQRHGAIAGPTHSHCITYPGNGEDPVLVTLAITQAHEVQGGQLVGIQAVGVLAPGGQKRLGGIKLDIMDATARLGPGRPCILVSHQRDAHDLAQPHLHHEERVALGATHYLPGVQLLQSEHLVEGTQGQLALLKQLGQFLHRVAAQLTLETPERRATPRSHLAALRVVH